MMVVGPLLLRATVAMGERHHQSIANVICICIAPFGTSTHNYLYYNYFSYVIYYGSVVL
jgi:hypothetical protein